MRTTKNLLTAVLAACAGLAGCAEADDQEPTPDEATRTKLYEHRTFRVDPGDARVSLRVTRRVGPHELSDERIAFDVLEGRITPTLDATGALVIDEIALALGDLDLGPASTIVPHLTFTDVELRVDGPVRCVDTDWSSDDLAAFCDLRLPVELGWRFRFGGEDLPFGGAYFLDVPVGLVVAPYDDQALWLWTHGSGEVGFPWGEQAVTTELTVHMDAYSGVIR